MVEEKTQLKSIISPSILSADFGNLGKDAESMIKNGADWLHVDVMDGHFVPNITIGPGVVKSLRKYTKAFLDVHLMVSNPSQWVDSFADAGSNGFTFHIETFMNDDETIDSKGVKELIKKIKNKGMKVGITVKPKTSIKILDEFLNDIDLVLIMTVEPGFGGQKFMGDMMSKVIYIREKYPEMNIEVDGGINSVTIEKAAKAGANVIVSGSYLFKSEDRKDAIAKLRKYVDDSLKLKKLQIF